MKLLKRLLLAVAIVLALIITAASVGIILYRGTPNWYHPLNLDPQLREAAAQRATNKLVMIQNQAARIRRDDRRARGGSAATVPVDRAAPITVSFTEDELNAFFDKWAVWNGWKSKYEKHITDPIILLSDGRIIVAAKARALNTVASLHFEPRITDQGLLDLRLVRVLGGRLPLPDAALSGYRQKLAETMLRNMPRWQATATIDSSGTPNFSAVAAAMGQLALHVLANEPAEPVLFVPLVDSNLHPRSVAVTLTDVRVVDHTLTLSVQPMTSTERAALLTRIREGGAVASGRVTAQHLRARWREACAIVRASHPIAERRIALMKISFCSPKPPLERH